jgi:AcrR family transcriptional regulator
MSEPEATARSGDTRERIMEATFRAVSKHGYTDLRVRDIGAEMELSRQVIHYHFDHTALSPPG